MFSFHDSENIYNETIKQTIFSGLIFVAIVIVLKYLRFHNYKNYLNASQAKAYE